MNSASTTAPTALDHEIAVIGSGFAGLGMAITLEQDGETDYAVYERADSLGGTWRDNHYPGCGCDIPTPLYSFSFAPNPDWSYLYARHDEIRAYLERCADDFGIRDRITFGNGITTAQWVNPQGGEGDAGHWRLTLDDGTSRTARLLVAGIGGLNRPSLPDIPGFEDFDGPIMHSAAWDHSVDLAGKRVAVIGTGASAIQLIPEIVRETAQVDVFQRTPPWVMPRTDFRIPGWMKTMFRRLPVTQRALRGFIWSLQESVAVPLTKAPALTRLLEIAGRLHMRRAISDPELRRRITPSYKVGCKRILPSNAYYPALARDDVDLVTDPIARVVADGIETGTGELREADVIVCATGFDIREAFEQGEVVGRNGISLGERWRDRIECHRGTMMSGFPNVFVLSGPNTGTGNMSQVFMIEAQIRFVKAAREQMRRRGVAQIEVTEEAQRAHNEELRERMKKTVWLTGGCNSWYLTDDGHTGVLYPGFSSTFRRELGELRESEYVFGAPPGPATAPPPEPPAVPTAATGS